MLVMTVGAGGRYSPEPERGGPFRLPQGTQAALPFNQYLARRTWRYSCTHFSAWRGQDFGEEDKTQPLRIMLDRPGGAREDSLPVGVAWGRTGREGGQQFGARNSCTGGRLKAAIVP